MTQNWEPDSDMVFLRSCINGTMQILQYKHEHEAVWARQTPTLHPQAKVLMGTKSMKQKFLLLCRPKT